MRTLDRYIIRQFLVNFFILLIVFGALFVLVDLLANLDEYVKGARVAVERTGRSMWWEFLRTLIDFDGPILILLYVFLAGLLVNAAIGFTFASLAHNGELTAMLTGGISMIRIAAPVLCMGAVLSLAALPIQEFVVPPMAHKLLRSHGDISEKRDDADLIFFAPDKRGNLISATHFDPVKQSMTGVMVLVRGELGETKRRLTARHAQWKPERDGWALQTVQMIDLESASSTRLEEPKVSSVPDHLLKSDLSPDVLLVRRSSTYMRLLSVKRLRELLGNPSADRHHSRIAHIIHNRFSFMVVQVLIMLMALPMFLLREPKSYMVQAVKAAFVCIGAWALAITLQQIGASQLNLNPVAGAWLPVVILLPVTALTVQTIKT